MSSEKSDDSQSSPSKPMWMEQFYNDDCYEVEVENNFGPVLLVPQVGRSFIWYYCGELLGTQEELGIAGQACQLLERYLATIFTKNVHVAIRSVEWQTTKAKLTEKLQLLISVCIQLSTKMLSANNHLHVNAVKRALQKYDLTYTIKEINDIETEVFKSIEFRIPLWTNVEKAQMVAQTLSNSRTMLEGVTLVMDIVEYHRLKVQDQVRYVVYENPSPSSSRDSEVGPSDSSDPMANIRSMHMVAGVVAATWRYFKEEGPDPLEQLAAWMKVSKFYIGCICNVILEHVIDNKYNASSSKRSSSPNKIESLKRKRQRFS